MPLEHIIKGDRMSKRTEVHTSVACNFPNAALAKEFMEFMCEQGEQTWWDWCDVRDVDDTRIDYDMPSKTIEFKLPA